MVGDAIERDEPATRVLNFAAMITGGFEECQGGSTYRVPKRDLITGLDAVIEQKRLEIVRHSRAGQELIAELSARRLPVSGFGREWFEAEGSRVHDDLVLAVSLAWWWVRRQGPSSCWGVAKPPI